MTCVCVCVCPNSATSTQLLSCLRDVHSQIVLSAANVSHAGDTLSVHCDVRNNVCVCALVLLFVFALCSRVCQLTSSNTACVGYVCSYL